MSIVIVENDDYVESSDVLVTRAPTRDVIKIRDRYGRIHYIRQILQVIAPGSLLAIDVWGNLVKIDLPESFSLQVAQQSQQAQTRQ